MNKSRYCYWLDQFQTKDQHEKNGVDATGFVPSVVVENKYGHSYASYPTKEDPIRLPYFWSDGFDADGLEQAKKIIDLKNQELGLTEKDVLTIVCSSMFASKETYKTDQEVFGSVEII